MDKDFADWYQAAGITPDSERLSKRWEALEKFTSALRIDALLDVVRLFYGLPPKDPEFIVRFREPFKAADSSFLMSRNVLELRLLAGSTVAAALSKSKSGNADVAALAMVCADFCGLRPGERPAVFLARARQYLLQRSAGLRSNSRSISVKIPKLPEGAVGTDPNAMSQAIGMLVEGLKNFAGSISKAMEQLDQAQLLRREESDILWWLFAGYSGDLERPLSEFDRAVACLIVAKELAYLVEVLPGPVSSRAILDRALRGPTGGGMQESVTLFDAVRRAPVDWLRNWVRGDEVVTRHGDLCLTLLAAQRFMEAPGSDAWVAAVDQLTGLNVRTELAPLSLAGQAYDEHRLVRAIKLAER